VKDVSIPGAYYSFGQLQLALALGDFRALVTHQRPVLRLHLTNGAERGITEVEAVLGATLANLRRMAT
jgi:glucose-6-phosphate isomerase